MHKASLQKLQNITEQKEQRPKETMFHAYA